MTNGIKIYKFLSIILICFTVSSFYSEKISYRDSIFPKGFAEIDKTRFTKGKPEDAISLRWEKLLNHTCRYILLKWWPESQCEGREGDYIDFGYLENNDKTGEFGKETLGGLRAPAEYAYVIAVSVFTNTFNPNFLETSESDAVIRAVTIIKSIAKDHKVNGGINHPWGDQWQSAQWASKCAAAGWLLWDHLADTDKYNVLKMIEFEANRFLDSTAAAANENYVNDTKAEEDGWNASGIQTACALMPHNPNFQNWLNKSIEYRVTALATEEDINSEKIINGRKISNLAEGFNIDSIGALGNHGAYPHPDYMAAPLRHTIEGSIFLSLSGHSIPVANKFNCNLIYQNFVNHKWNNESAIYKRDGSIYWPIKIEDDRRFEFITFGIIDAGAVLLNYDDLADVKGEYWEELHTQNAMNMDLTGFISASSYLLHWLNYQGIKFD